MNKHLSVITQRGAFEQAQTRLLVDYYRIRHRVAFPLPLEEFHVPELKVRGLDIYPWTIWMLWRLEERFHALYNAYHFTKVKRCGEILVDELEHFASWSTYNQLKRIPDLATGHSGCLLHKALTEWKDLPRDITPQLRKACKVLVDESYPQSIKSYAAATDVETVLKHEKPSSFMHNIPLIGSLGVALAASAVEDVRSEDVIEKVRTIFMAILQYGLTNDYSEGPSYDGYIMDFMLDAIHLFSGEDRHAMLSHPVVGGIMEQTFYTSVCGSAGRRAPLGDVEPLEMPFDISALVKYQHHVATEGFEWFIQGLDEAYLRSDAISHLPRLVETQPEQTADRPSTSQTATRPAPPARTVTRTRNAVALRSGWDADDISVVVSASNSTAAHVQVDCGSVVIGTRGVWLIADPGYQQYLDTSERRFTLGTGMHNHPIINGVGPTLKAMRILDIAEESEKSVTLYLTDCYEGLGATTVSRKIQVLDKTRLVIRDRIVGGSAANVDYTWHGSPDGFAYLDVHALSQENTAALWFRAVDTPFPSDALQRLSGSRGSLSYQLRIARTTHPIWWIFTTWESQIEPARVLADGSLLWGETLLPAEG